MCRWRNVAVFDACFFRFGNPSGYVVHEEPKDFTTAFLISFGPFFVNSTLCFLICLPSLAPMQMFDAGDPLSYLLMWLGISIGAHAFPSTHDAKCVWELAKIAAKRGNVLAIVSFPIVVALFAANALRVVWADFIYAGLIGYGLPAALLGWWLQ